MSERNGEDLSVWRRSPRAAVQDPMGGDEFAILLPETDEVQAIAVAERISNKIKSESVATDRGSPAALLDAADQALYMAKLAGKNCVAQFRRSLADEGVAAEQSGIRLRCCG